MGLLDLTVIELVQGSLSLLYVVITLLLGIKILLKYLEYKKPEFLLIAVWMNFHHQWPAAISFVGFILFDYTLDPPVFLFIVLGFVTIGTFSWTLVFSRAVIPNLKRKKLMKGITAYLRIMALFFLFLFAYWSIIDYTVMGTVEKFNMEGNTSLMLLLLAIGQSVTLLTFIVLYRSCKKSEDLKVQWGGRLILISNLVFVFSQVLDGFPISITILMISRILLVLSSLFVYIGWFMPDKIAKWLIKGYISSEKETERPKAGIEEILEIIGTRRVVTEEEVTYFREKKICLICKGKVMGFNFICPKCDALYCTKCAQALSKIENACWACNEPIDKSKPVKIEETNEKIEISDKIEEKN